MLITSLQQNRYTSTCSRKKHVMQYKVKTARITRVSFLKEPAFISADSFTETN